MKQPPTLLSNKINVTEEARVGVHVNSRDDMAFTPSQLRLLRKIKTTKNTPPLSSRPHHP